MNKRRLKNCENKLVGGFEEKPKMEVSCRRNDCFHFSAWNQGVHGLNTKITRIPIGTSTSNMINNFPWIKKTHGHLNAVLLVIWGIYVYMYIHIYATWPLPNLSGWLPIVPISIFNELFAQELLRRGHTQAVPRDRWGNFRCSCSFFSADVA